MDLGLAGKIALVAGGSRGCGRGISEALAREGARVVLTGRQKEVVEACSASIRKEGGSAHGVVAEMSEKAGATRMVNEARAVFGDPDILVVNSPGIIPGTGPQGKHRGLNNTTRRPDAGD
jgi:3-oxoacyl-[acyl-carrier protein] reductase